MPLFSAVKLVMIFKSSYLFSKLFKFLPSRVKTFSILALLVNNFHQDITLPVEAWNHLEQINNI